MFSRKRCFILAVSAVVVLLDAERLLAWGPATHAKLAGDVLSNLSLLVPAVGAIISRHVRDYLYGTLATDVVFAKRLSRIKQFCHHWSTGFRLLDEADNDRARAFAYGYLSHLAADTVAHGRFVPYQIASTGTTINFGHLYWELRADARIDELTWTQLDSVMLMDHAVHQAALGRVLTDTFLPHEINRTLFERINRTVAKRGWRRSIEMWGRWSRRQLSTELLAGYHTECIDRTICLLNQGRNSPVLHEDPSGSAALAFAADTRRMWRRRRRRGLPLFQRQLETAAGHAPQPWPIPITTTPCSVVEGCHP